MNFYIVDDDKSVLGILKNVIEKDFTNNVVGMSTNSARALKEIMLLTKIDIILVDLLMPDLSGIDLINKIRNNGTNIRFIMISKVKDDNLRTKAYNAGIEFFINKPINIIEVKTVIEKVIQNIKLANQLNSIQEVVNGFSSLTTIQRKNDINHKMAVAREILYLLGIISEKGANDILAIIQLALEKENSINTLNLEKEFHITSHEKRIMEQRIRRAIKTGLTNLATQLADDPGNEILTTYASTLFEYKSVHEEMQYLQNKSTYRGRVSNRHFLEGLLETVYLR